MARQEIARLPDLARQGAHSLTIDSDILLQVWAGAEADDAEHVACVAALLRDYSKAAT